MAKKPGVSGGEPKRTGGSPAELQRKKRLADALRRNLAKRKGDKDAGPGEEPNTD
jgi:hypothetical protein